MSNLPASNIAYIQDQDLNIDMPPGLLLKSQREKLGLTTTEVANRLKISDSYVKAIESDNYEALPEMTFIQGYVKNYATLLHLDEEDIKNRLQTSVTEKQFIIKGMPKRKKTGSISLFFSLVFVVVLIAIGGLAGMWYYHSHHHKQGRPIVAGTVKSSGLHASEMTPVQDTVSLSPSGSKSLSTTEPSQDQTSVK